MHVRCDRPCHSLIQSGVLQVDCAKVHRLMNTYPLTPKPARNSDHVPLELMLFTAATLVPRKRPALQSTCVGTAQSLLNTICQSPYCHRVAPDFDSNQTSLSCLDFMHRSLMQSSTVSCVCSSCQHRSLGLNPTGAEPCKADVMQSKGPASRDHPAMGPPPLVQRQRRSRPH